jgi:hypothetical protein
VGAPIASAHLNICGSFVTPNPGNAPARLACTTDDGQTWAELPLPGSLKFGPPTVGPDGALYTIGSSGGNETLAWYRLPPDVTQASAWHLLGAIPAATYGVAGLAFPSGAGMVFWIFPSITTGSGETTAQPNYYIATYP